MDGDAAEHVREAIPVLAGYADVLGSARLRFGDRPRRRSRRHRLPGHRGPFLEAAGQPRVGDRPPLPGARRLEDDRRARYRASRQARPFLGEPSQGPAARRAGGGAADGGAARHGGDGPSPEAYALPEPLLAEARQLAADNGGSVVATGDRAAALDGAATSLRQVLVVGDALRRYREGAGAARRPRRLVRRRELVRQRPERPLHALPAGAAQRRGGGRGARLAAQRRDSPGAQPALGADGGVAPDARQLRGWCHAAGTDSTPVQLGSTRGTKEMR